MTENKRERIIKVARRLFVEQGFQHTTTAAISKKAGIGTGTLFKYFKSKKFLIDHLYLESFNSISILIKQGFVKGRSAEDHLQLIFHNTCHWALQNQVEYQFYQLYLLSPYWKRLSEKLQHVYIPILKPVKEIIKQKKLKSIEKEFAGRIYITFWMATVNYLLGTSDVKAQQKYIAQAFSYFRKCLF